MLRFWPAHDPGISDRSPLRLNGIEATRQITRRAPQTKVLVLSMYSDEAYVVQMLKAGPTGYLRKDSADLDLLQAVQAVSEGKSFFSPAVARLMSDDYARQRGSNAVDRYESLSDREREIFQLVAEGRIGVPSVSVENQSGLRDPVIRTSSLGATPAFSQITDAIL